jgi:hypothetical protein
MSSSTWLPSARCSSLAPATRKPEVSRAVQPGLLAAAQDLAGEGGLQQRLAARDGPSGTGRRDEVLIRRTLVVPEPRCSAN